MTTKLNLQQPLLTYFYLSHTLSEFMSNKKKKIQNFFKIYIFLTVWMFIRSLLINWICPKHFIKNIPSSSGIWWWISLHPPWCPGSRYGWAERGTFLPCWGQVPGYEESAWSETQKPGKHHTSLLKTEPTRCINTLTKSRNKTIGLNTSYH